MEMSQQINNHSMTTSAFQTPVVPTSGITASRSFVPSLQEGCYVMQLTANVDESVLGVATSEGEIKCYNFQTLSFTQSLSGGHNAAIQDANFSPVDAHILASGSLDGRCRIWDVRSGQAGCVYNAPGDECSQVKFSPDGQMVALALDSKIALWDVRSGKILSVLDEVHTDTITQVYFHPLNPSIVVSGSEDGTICFCNINSPDPEDNLELCLSLNGEAPRTIIPCGANNQLIACATHSGHLLVYDIEGNLQCNYGDIRKQPHLQSFVDHSEHIIDPKLVQSSIDYVVGMEYLPNLDKLCLIAGSFGGTAQLLTVEDRGLNPLVMLAQGHRDVVRSYYWNPKRLSNVLFTGGEDGIVNNWTLPQGTVTPIKQTRITIGQGMPAMPNFPGGSNKWISERRHQLRAKTGTTPYYNS